MIQLAYIDTDHKQKKRYIQPDKLPGQSFGVHLKDGGSFYFKCTGNGCTKFDNVIQSNHITGYDTEGTDLKIDIEDIDMVTGVDVNEQ